MREDANVKHGIYAGCVIAREGRVELEDLIINNKNNNKDLLKEIEEDKKYSDDFILSFQGTITAYQWRIPTSQR